MTALPLVLYVPGLLPKPEHGLHRDALFRCLIAGLRRHDEKTALEIAANLHCFDVVSWTYGFYNRHRDIAIDQDAIEAVIEQPAATAEDIAEARSWKRRLARWVFSLAVGKVAWTSTPDRRSRGNRPWRALQFRRLGTPITPTRIGDDLTRPHTGKECPAAYQPGDQTTVLVPRTALPTQIILRAVYDSIQPGRYADRSSLEFM